MNSEKRENNVEYIEKRSKTYQSPSQLLTQRPPQPAKETAEKKKDN